MITKLTIKITSMELARPEIFGGGNSNPVIAEINGHWLSGCFRKKKFYSDTQGVFRESRVNYWFEIPDELI